MLINKKEKIKALARITGFGLIIKWATNKIDSTQPPIIIRE